MSKHSFSTLPSSKRARVRFSDNWDVTMTMSVGKLYPVMLEEVLPGDDFSENISFVSRLTSTFLRPVMDDLVLDVYAFNIPGRILYDNYEGVFGNPKPSAYVDNDLGQIPTMAAGTVSSKSVADYLGLPVGSVPSGLSVLPFRAFAFVWNEWFRNENTTDEVFVQNGELSSSEVLNNNPWGANNYTGQLPSVGKIKDYFTSAVPQPQKGSPVLLPLSGYAPVMPTSVDNDIILGQTQPVKMVSVNGTPYPTNRSLNIQSSTSYLDTAGFAASADTQSAYPIPINFQADLSLASAANVDELRLATQKQLMLMADTMYGSRYREYIFGHYGVNIGDNTVQVPEYLTGKRIPLDVAQVAQTTSTANDQDNSLGSLAGYSYTTAQRQAHYFKGFKEHGYVLWVACIRQKHTYQQGIRKLWGRSVRDDFYDPLYAHIGYQPIYKSELYAQGQQLKGDIFGWQEAWSEYKHTFGNVTGEARTSAPNTLDIYHFADVYSSAPVIGAQFNEEVPQFVDRTLSVPSTSQDQFIVQFHCNSNKTRVMPVYCEPGYMDHWNK